MDSLIDLQKQTVNLKDLQPLVKNEIPLSERTLLEWNDLNFFVPVKSKAARAKEQEGEALLKNKDATCSGLPQETFVKRANNKHYKQILFGAKGFVRPGEMMAILGPSGSGKTSLLNVLSQRTGLSGGSKKEGQVTINGRALRQGSDYGKVAAFVQQDDVLQATSTVRELLTFAGRIRTNLEGEALTSRVQSVISRFGLGACADSLVGGWLRRGISGGERKRTSIGYELITDPSLLLLDEPTSGLDSSTALRILQLLRGEARRGMAVLATIHQPSAALFNVFDRVILLSEGYVIYNGPPSNVQSYFN